MGQQQKRRLIYTDGACSQNGTWKGGWGVVVIDENSDNIELRLSGSAENTTNNAMEMEAFLAALRHIEDHALIGPNHTTYAIHSDSAYILNCFINKWYVNWRRNGWRNAKKEPVANKELWENILDSYERLIGYNVSVELIKVKGHAGNKYNEMADQLAVEASK